MAVGTMLGGRNRRVISTLGPECMSAGMASATNQFASPASGTWGTANRAVFIPVTLRRPFVLQKMGVLNGATATGNIDLGIYTEDGVRIWSSGSVAQSGTNVFQLVTPGSPVKLTAGRYYMAMATNSTSSTITGRLATQALARFLGAGIQASAFALPSTATIAAAPAALRVPNILMSDRVTV